MKKNGNTKKMKANVAAVVGVLRKHRKDVNPTRLRYQRSKLTKQEEGILRGSGQGFIIFDRFLVLVPETSPAFRPLLEIGA